MGEKIDILQTNLAYKNISLQAFKVLIINN